MGHPLRIVDHGFAVHKQLSLRNRERLRRRAGDQHCRIQRPRAATQRSRKDALCPGRRWTSRPAIEHSRILGLGGDALSRNRNDPSPIAGEIRERRHGQPSVVFRRRGPTDTGRRRSTLGSVSGRGTQAAHPAAAGDAKGGPKHDDLRAVRDYLPGGNEFCADRAHRLVFQARDCAATGISATNVRHGRPSLEGTRRNYLACLQTRIQIRSLRSLRRIQQLGASRNTIFGFSCDPHCGYG
mmetsp:Transcript_20098/g.43732  ORF Transcript_20098/g.43732 Transcript_20098/m.43732 type:complete len:240 (+) Transcript_20098:919-1638(+)